MRSVAVSLFFILVAGSALAAESDITGEGKIVSVDPKKMELTLKRPAGSTITLTWNKFTDMYRDGDRLKPAELRKGMEVKISYYKSNKRLTQVVVTFTPDK